MLALDSLVIDLIFQQGAAVQPEALLAALGGDEVAATRKLLDPDMQDPRFEMELSPSMPFRRRDERRLMIIDDTVAPMRKDPRTDFIVPLDLRAERDRLIRLCESLEVRLGRLSALGSWADAVLIARSAVDLRAISLISWALDPTVDVQGNKRAQRLTKEEFEEKIAAYDKRLDELSEQDILAELSAARFERRGELLIVDVLENDGTWDIRRSLAVEHSLAAVAKFSLFPGVPAGQDKKKQQRAAGDETSPGRADRTESEHEAALAPLRSVELDGRVILIFPAERFDVEVAARLGKRSFGEILDRSDPIAGPVRDAIHRDGADFVAPLEFLSEVFIDGTPLSRVVFDERATEHKSGLRTLDVHCPRFGPVVLLDIPGRGRFISSAKNSPDTLAELVG
ncbi:MAG: hypothetical protein MJE77_24550 [Proteobacteria bacterium]|nr:hypothetical protein [Pseudomonadota bacterium]